MTAKTYLEQLQRLDIMINQKIREREDLKSKAGSIGAVDYSKLKADAASGEAPFEKITDHICDLEREINAEIDCFVDKKHEIIKQIQSLDVPNHIDFLFKRYVEFKKYEQIALEMGRAREYMPELNSKALKSFEKFHKNLLKLV